MPKPSSCGSTRETMTNDMTTTAAAGAFGSLSGTLEYVVDKQWRESVSSGASAISDEEDDLTLGSRVNSVKAFGVSELSGCPRKALEQFTRASPVPFL